MNWHVEVDRLIFSRYEFGTRQINIELWNEYEDLHYWMPMFKKVFIPKSSNLWPKGLFRLRPSLSHGFR